MGLYQCEKCGCVENTALGHYHCRDMDMFKDYQEDTEKGMELCSACGPLKYDDDNYTKYGKWHGKFERTFYVKGSLETNNVGNVQPKDPFTNMKELEIKNAKE